MNKAERQRRYATNWQQIALDAKERIKQLEADNAALRKDALRYRWLRQRNDDVGGGLAANIRVKYRLVESDFDAAIDAALLAGKDKP